MTGPYFKIAGLLFSLFFYFLSFQTLSAQISGRIQASSGRLKQISERGYILVGLQKDYYPFHIEGKKSRGPGIDMEIAQILAKSLGVELKVKFFNLPDLLKAVEKGDIDLSAGGISSSLERAKKNAFSEPYLVTTPGGLLSKRVLPPESESSEFLRERIRGLSDINKLGRLKIGVMKNTRNEDLLRNSQEFDRHKIIGFTDRAKLIRALLKGDIDLLVGDAISIHSLQKTKKIPASFIPLVSPYREENISFVLPRGDAELELYMNFFVRAIKSDGRLNKIITRYLK